MTIQQYAIQLSVPLVFAALWYLLAGLQTANARITKLEAQLRYQRDLSDARSNYHRQTTTTPRQYERTK
jgi:hypothetical protein